MVVGSVAGFYLVAGSFAGTFGIWAVAAVLLLLAYSPAGALERVFSGDKFCRLTGPPGTGWGGVKPVAADEMVG